MQPYKMLPTEHMLLSVRGGRWKEAWLALFTVYIDDSGTSPSQHVAIASCLLVPAKRIVALENEWNTFKAKEGFSCFHMSEFVALNPKSEFAGWAEKQYRIAKRVRTIVKKYGTKAISFSVNKADYDELMPEEMKNFAGKYHYTWAIRHLLMFVDQWAVLSNVKEPLEFIFDKIADKRTDPRRVEIEEVMDQAEELAIERGVAGKFSHYNFRFRCELPALQCADILAWTCYQRSLFGFRGTPMKPIATDAWGDFDAHLNNTWMYAVSVRRGHLADWIKREIADGRSIERFRQREATKSGGGL